MLVSAISSLKNFYYKQNSQHNKFQPTGNNSYITDRFERSDITFSGTTSAGYPLKKLRNVPCPYFGINMIPSSDIGKIEKELSACTTVKKAVRYLKQYEPNMQKTEKAIFQRFEEASDNSPRMQFPQLLKKWYDDAIIKLKLEEFAVIDEIDRISLEMSPATALKVRANTTLCRSVILENNPENTFKRKTVIDSLNNVEPAEGEEKIMRTLLDRANYLPTSATSENAFIVKYSDRSHEEISRRLVRASAATIEHVIPDSKGGENSMDNFLLASANANNLRQNMPLKNFIAMFPQIPENCQKYIENIIEKIHNGGLKGNQAYPYNIKNRLQKASNGRIKLDLSNFMFTKSEAKELEKLSQKEAQIIIMAKKRRLQSK